MNECIEGLIELVGVEVDPVGLLELGAIVLEEEGLDGGEEVIDP